MSREKRKGQTRDPKARESAITRGKQIHNASVRDPLSEMLPSEILRPKSSVRDLPPEMLPSVTAARDSARCPPDQGKRP